MLLYMIQKIRKITSKKDRNNYTNGIIHINSTFNNTIVTITNLTGNTISWASAGSSGFKGARKGTPFAAQTAAEKAAAEALNIMEHKQITSLVVINDDKTVVGLLTLNQLLKSGIE